MRPFPFYLAIAILTMLCVDSAFSQRITGVKPPSRQTPIRPVRPPIRIVPPDVKPNIQPNVLPKVYPKVTLLPKLDRGRLMEALQNKPSVLSPGRKLEFDRGSLPAIKLDPQRMHKLDAYRLNAQDLQRFRELDLDRFIAEGAFQALHERLQNADIDRSLREMVMDGSGRNQLNQARGFLIIPGKLILVWRPLWWRSYPYFVPIPIVPGPVPICVHGSSSPVVVQSPVPSSEGPPDEPPKPDLAIVLAHCLLPSVIAGKDVGPVMQIAAACLSVEPVEGVAIDVFLCREADAAKCARPAAYSPRFADGALLKDGRERVSFPGHGLLNVPMTGALTIPADTPSGDYYLGVVIDSDRQVAESDETNNVQFVPLRVTAPGQTSP